MKISIIGLGFVGKALDNALKEDVSRIHIDPTLGTSIDDLKSFDPDIIFVCVPTPMTKHGTQDISILENVLNEIKINIDDPFIVLKSTVLPDNISLLNNFNDFVYNPEFLREKSANQDFINSSLILFGGNINLCNKLAKFYDKFTKCISKDYIYTDIEAAALIKFSINSFLATKVIFFNQLNEIFMNSGTKESWHKFISIIDKDNRIGSSHMDVPGHDNRKGFGGACFPKDTHAFNEYSKKINKGFTLLDSVIQINNEIRSQYKNLTEREKEQDIFFNDN